MRPSSPNVSYHPEQQVRIELIAQHRGPPQQRTLHRGQPVDLASRQLLNSRRQLVRVLAAGHGAGELPHQHGVSTRSGREFLGNRRR